MRCSEHVNSLQSTVTCEHLLEQIVPCVAREIDVAESVEEQILPDASVIPVSAPCGDDGFVGRESVQVPHSASRALQALRGVAAAYAVVDAGHSIEPQFVDVVAHFIGRNAVGRLILKEFVTRAKRYYGGYQQYIGGESFHNRFFLERDGNSKVIRAGDRIYVFVIDTQRAASR